MDFQFKDFGIKTESTSLLGDKISIDKVIGKEIKVQKYKIQPSKFENKGECLHMQIEYNSITWVIFVSAPVLIEMIKQVPDNKFPFKTTISKDKGHLEFT